jgi:hypothetical protein
MTDQKVDVPTSAAEDNKNQSISSANQKGNVISAQPVVDAGIDAKPGFWTGNGLEIVHTEVE